jgi:hypothetical protein
MKHSRIPLEPQLPYH